MNATPMKLRDGSWGARVEGSTPNVGTTVTIHARNGKSWEANVTGIVWSSPEGNLHFCRTLGVDPPRGRSRSRGRGRSSRAIAIEGLGDRTYYRNASGVRCEDAPCCGCCTI